MVSTWPPTGGSTIENLGDIEDVTLINPQSNDHLVFDGTDWVNVPDVTALNDITDVTLTSSAKGDVLYYDTTTSKWVNGKEAQTLIVGKVGKRDFDSVQAAIDSITDNSASKHYIIKGMGQFTEDVVLKPYVHLVGSAGLTLAGPFQINGRLSGTGLNNSIYGLTVVGVAPSDGSIIHEMSGSVIIRSSFIIGVDSNNYALTVLKVTPTNASDLFLADVCSVVFSDSTVGRTSNVKITESGAGAGRFVWTDSSNRWENCNVSSGNHEMISIVNTGEVATRSPLISWINTVSFSGTIHAINDDSTGSTAQRDHQSPQCRLDTVGDSGSATMVHNTSGTRVSVATPVYKVVGFSDGLVYSQLTDTSSETVTTFATTNISMPPTGAGANFITPYQDAKSGFIAWLGAGAYVTIVGDQCTINRTFVGAVRSNEVVCEGGQTVTLTANATNYIYSDSKGILGVVTTPADSFYLDGVPCLQVLYDGTVTLQAVENHPYTIDTATSQYLHKADGTLLIGSGGDMVAGTTVQRLSINGDAEISDHGLYSDLLTQTDITMRTFYKNVPGKWIQYKTGLELINAYNNAGTPTLSTAGNAHFVFRIYATKGSFDAAVEFVAVMGTVLYTSVSNAQAAINAGSIPVADGELAAIELTQLGFVIVKYENAGQPYKIATIDIQKQVAGANISGGAGGNNATNITMDVSNFDRFLTGAETTSQSVADRVDDLAMSPSTTDTMTNKTIDADNNTISNLEHGAEVDNPTSGVHGVVGSVVGTSDTQTLTNKTIDADNNTISNLAHGAEVDNPTSGVHGVTGSVVGTSDTQTLTNKTIDADDNSVWNVNRLNYFKHGDFENQVTTGWTTTTNTSVSINTSTPLRGLASLAMTFTASATAADYVQSPTFTVDTADLNKALKLEYVFSGDANLLASQVKVEIIADPDGTPVVIQPSEINQYPGSGTWLVSWASSSETEYAVRWTSLVSRSDIAVLTIDDVISGPGSATPGVPVEDAKPYTDVTWRSGWSITTSATRSRNGQNATYNIKGSLVTAAATGLFFTIGDTIDVSALGLSGASSEIKDIGTLAITTSTGAFRFTGRIAVQGSGPTAVFLYYFDDAGDCKLLNLTSTAPVTLVAGDILHINFTVPIAEWSSNVQMAESSVEFASNSDNTNAASNIVDFVYGSAGSLIPNGAAGTTYTRRVRFRTPIQPTDIITVEVQDSTTKQWLPFEDRFYAHNIESAKAYGVGLTAVSGSTTDINVNFEDGGIASTGVTYASNGTAWSAVAAFKWRVRKQKNAALIGVDGTFVTPIDPRAGIIGRTDGAPGAGEIGEYLEEIGSGVSPTSNVFGDGGNTGLTLGVGVYDLHAVTACSVGAATLSEVYLGIGTASGTTTTGLDSNRNTTIIPFGGITANAVRVSSPTFRVVITSGTQTFYPKTRFVFGTSTLSVASSIFARRIA